MFLERVQFQLTTTGAGEYNDKKQQEGYSYNLWAESVVGEGGGWNMRIDARTFNNPLLDYATTFSNNGNDLWGCRGRHFLGSLLPFFERDECRGMMVKHKR